MKAVLLAAGKGERFYPFNAHRAKPMFPVCNRPLLDRLVERVVHAGLTDIAIVVAPRDGSVRSWFADGARFGCRITYVEQPDPAGTADAVVRAHDYIGSDPFTVLLGDLHVGPRVLPAVLEAYAAADHGVAATIDVDNVSEHTRVTVGGDGTLTDYVWKPRGGRGTALAGIYAFPAGAVDDLANVSDVVRAQFGIAPHRGKEIEDVVPLLHREGRPLAACPVDGPIFDMDYPWQPDTFGDRIVEQLGADLTESRIHPTAVVDPDARVEGPIVVGEKAVIGRDAYVRGPAWIGARTRVTDGSHIGPGTVVGDDCHIGPYAKVDGFVGNDCRITYLGEFSGTMLDGGRVTHQIQLSGVFGLGAEIGAGTQCGTLRFDDGPIEVEVCGRRRVAHGFSGVLFGDYARTGVGAMMMPGRIVGPCSMVGAGVVLMKNLPAHKALLLKQETELVDWSPEIYNR